MAPAKLLHLAAALFLVSCVTPHQADRPASSAHVVVSAASERPPSPGGSEHFTGHAEITPVFAATEHTRAAGAYVTFEPGARTAWHTHPAGQTLIVTAGAGWVQEWGGEKRELHVGDVVWTPPGVKHWHGATAATSMTHLAVQEHVDGKVVDWLERVSAAQYGGD